MTDQDLTRLANAAGIATSWKDVFDKTHHVSADTLRAVLEALGYPASCEQHVRDSHKRVTAGQPTLPPLITADQGQSIPLPLQPGLYQLHFADGRRLEGRSELHSRGSTLPAISEPGYHTLVVGNASTTIAVAPARCFSVPDALSGSKSWGMAVQLYALRRPGDAGVGDLQALAQFARSAAAAGAQALGISPLHAQFSADAERFAPYAPSSRTALNVLHIATDMRAPDLEQSDLVDWPNTAKAKLRHLRQQFANYPPEHPQRRALAEFRRSQGARLQGHAVFEALHAHFLAQDTGLWHWQHWPSDFRDPQSASSAAFAKQHSEEIEFHAWLQFLADQQLGEAQQACRSVGMKIGLITDLAVGADSGGSQCWSRQAETLMGLTVGAPPDLMQRKGQNWGLTAFSPTGLVQSGFATYRDMLHTALVHAGGMRIDHALGLNRLWVIPEGARASEGAYLSFPERDFISLIKLHSHLHRAVILAEDLGTVPDGFQDRLSDAAIEGMRILWFEREASGRFKEPASWTRKAAAMTSTHDLPTLSGWWSGRDLDWQARLGRLEDEASAREERDRDRRLLWDALENSGATAGELPDAEHARDFVDAACRHVGGSACEFVMLPLEDVLGQVEQPNLPGTTDEHPNWRRRVAAATPDTVLHEAAQARLQSMNDARQS